MVKRTAIAICAGLTMATLSGCGQSTSTMAKAQLRAEAVLSTPSWTPAASPIPTPPATPPPNNSTEFILQSLLGSGVHGDVVVTPTAAGAQIQVTVLGLNPGSRHTIHDHRGTCGAANSSIHLSTLDTSAADGAGAISINTSVPASEIGPGRIVIVYSTASHNVIVSCAQL
jgi:hypothetical protein